MLITGLVLFVLGTLMSVAAFGFAAYNMFKGAANFKPSAIFNEEGFDFKAIFKLFGGHLAAMVAMIFGGAVASFGLILTVVALVMLFVPAAK